MICQWFILGLRFECSEWVGFCGGWKYVVWTHVQRNPNAVKLKAIIIGDFKSNKTVLVDLLQTSQPYGSIFSVSDRVMQLWIWQINGILVSAVCWRHSCMWWVAEEETLGKTHHRSAPGIWWIIKRIPLNPIWEISQVTKTADRFLAKHFATNEIQFAYCIMDRYNSV